MVGMVLSFVQPPKFEFYDPKTPFYTSPRFLPPTKVEKCRVRHGTRVFFLHHLFDTCILKKKVHLQIVDAIISHGCFLQECSVEHSIVGVRSRLEYGVELKVSKIFLFGLLPPSLYR